MKYLYKIQVNLPTYGSFWIGALAGTGAWMNLGRDALIIPFALVYTAAVITLGYCFVSHYILKKDEPSLREAEYSDPLRKFIGSFGGQRRGTSQSDPIEDDLLK
eukprot:TRINITY_DN4230_c0_g1_i4.p1 TRINITY_DN4230_c0_g1~~TRINITY_DN4230_c0_g1_i4.p1  ORF type:complete len:104 (+),score=24.65 TRINITY_DN4230_c0_g1_i4:45-356(+)